MEREKIKLSVPVAVEGKYDKIRLSGIIDATIITTDGFGVFKSHEKLSLIKKLAQNGIIVLTDSDGAGKVIRNYIASAVPKDRIYNLYVPRVKGTERRKNAPSKEGILGVEGIDSDTLYSIFSDFVKRHSLEGNGRGEQITKADFFEAGLTGAEDSKAQRDSLCVKLGLPTGMSATALLSALSVLMSRNEFLKLYEGDSNEEQY